MSLLAEMLVNEDSCHILSCCESVEHSRKILLRKRLAGGWHGNWKQDLTFSILEVPTSLGAGSRMPKWSEFLKDEKLAKVLFN